MNKTTKTLLALGACVILVSISLFDNWEYRQRKKTGEQTIGTISSGLSNISWTYSVDGQIYKRRLSKSHYYFMQDGEKYIIYYDKEDPEQSSLAATEPVIDETSFEKTRSLPLRLSFDKGSHEVAFEFLVNNDTIKRTNRVLFNNDFNQPEKTYTVYYRPDRPIISYIRIENK